MRIDFPLFRGIRKSSLNNRSVEGLESKEYGRITDRGGMASSQETQMMIKAASCSGGLSRDAILSLGLLAERSVRPARCLEDVLEELDLNGKGGLDKLHRIKNTTRNSSYLD